MLNLLFTNLSDVGISLNISFILEIDFDINIIKSKIFKFG